MSAPLEVRRLDRFLWLVAQTMRTDIRVCLFWVSLIFLPIYGVKSPTQKKTIFGASIGVFELNVHNIESFILSKLLQAIDCNQILYNDRNHQVQFVRGLILRPTNPRWRTAAILKNR